MATIGNRSYKALWHSVAAKCVLSLYCYQSISPKFKTELYESSIKIRAANGSLIKNRGKCDLTFKINNEQFTFPFLCSDQLSQQLILGHNFAKAFHIGPWGANDTMSLTINGRTFAETIPAKNIQALVFCSEGAIVPPYSNGYIPCRLPKLLRHSNPGRNFVFEPSYKHRSNYSGCDTYDGLVTLDDTIVKTGIFSIVITNRSNKHIKIDKGQTIGMLRTCEEDQICTIHKIATFNSSEIGSRHRHEDYDNGEECPRLIKERQQKLYHIPT